MRDVIVVKFLKNDLPYTRGEIAGFREDIARKLIERGFAEQHGDGKPKQTGTRIPDPFGYSSGFSDLPKNLTK